MIDISAQYTHHDGSGYDLCQLAQAAADADVSVLNSGKLLALRKDLTKSLANVKICDLLDAAALAHVGAPAASASPEFGDWACSWAGNGDLSIRLQFDQGPFTPDGGQQTKIQSYPVSVEPDGDGGGPDCLVVIRYQPIPGNEQSYEMVNVVVHGSGSSTALCTPARQLADDVATHLPR